MIKESIAQLVLGKSLTKDESYATMKDIMEGVAMPSQIAGFLVALRIKGETVPEIAGCALAMRDAALRPTLHSQQLVDCCGTGGDGKAGFNVSTAAAFVVAGAGLKVAKHGNRAISSKSGSADILERLGVRIDPPLAVVEQAIDEVGIAFLFAPHFHPAMKHAMPTRKELGLRTVFNLLGPLTNPARAQVQLIGVYSAALTEPIAKVMAQMGHKAGLVVHSNGWDEITLDAKTKVSEMAKGRVKSYFLSAKDFGLPKVSANELKGGDANHNASLLTDILEGKSLPLRHVVLANAAAVLWIADRGYGKGTLKLKEAVKLADEAIRSGAALAKFRALADVSHNIE